MEEQINKIQAELKEKQEQLLIDDVIDIYNGKYKNYESYYKEKHRLNEIIYQTNKKSITFNPEKTNFTYNYYVYLPIYDERTFNYIKTKGGQRQ